MIRVLHDTYKKALVEMEGFPRDKWRYVGWWHELRGVEHGSPIIVFNLPDEDIQHVIESRQLREISLQEAFELVKCARGLPS